MIDISACVEHLGELAVVFESMQVVLKRGVRGKR